MSGVDIYVVGLGMVGYSQVTREVRNIFEKVGKIYTLHNQELVLDYCGKFTEDLVDLRKEYAEEEDRIEIYNRMADRILTDAQSSDKQIALAVYGHPLLAVAPSKFIIERADNYGLDISVRPGISSLDSLYVDLELDPVQNGLQVYEATDFVVREFEPNISVPLFLLQIGVFGTSLHSTAKSKPERFRLLKNYLTDYYPPNHSVKIIKTSMYPLVETEEMSVRLSNFEKIHKKVTVAHTLYVPPVEQKEAKNHELENKIKSTDHLDNITK